MTSPTIQAALDRLKELRDEHRSLTLGEYIAAEEYTNGVMLNQRGLDRGIDPYHLFTHNRTFFLAYASEELVEWCAAHPHLSFAEFERMMLEPEDQSPF